MPFEGLSSSPSQNRAPTERRRAPRAKAISIDELRAIHDARKDLRGRLDTLNRSYNTGADSARSENRTRQDEIRERQTRIRSNNLADNAAATFTNRLAWRERSMPTRQARAQLESATQSIDDGFIDTSPRSLNDADLDRINAELEEALGSRSVNRARPDRRAARPISEDDAIELDTSDIIDVNEDTTLARHSPTRRTLDRVREEPVYEGEVIDFGRPDTRGRQKTPEFRIFDSEVVPEPAVERGDFRHAEQESVIVDPEYKERADAFARDPRVAALEANRNEMLAVLADARASAARAEARVNAVGAEFRQATEVDIEAYLAGTASFADRAKVAMKNVGAALKKPWNFVKGIFTPRPAADLEPDTLSPQAIIEQYEAARAAAAEAHARTIQPEGDAMRIQEQINALGRTAKEQEAYDIAAHQRAMRARADYAVSRNEGKGGVGPFLSTQRPDSNSNTAARFESIDDDDVSVGPRGYHPTALRTGHRAEQSVNPMREMPGIRKLAPLYAGPELSRTNGIKGAEAYDNVMDVPGFADRVNSLTDEDMDSFLAEAPAPISPEAAPWRETSSGGSEAPSFIETLETVASAVSRNRQEGLKIADRAYELLENDSDMEHARRAHERFAIMGNYAKHLDQIVKTMVKDHGSISEQDVMEFARDTSAHGSRMLSLSLTKALKKVGRERSIPSINEADNDQLAEIALLVRTLLQAKAEIAPVRRAASPAPTYDRRTYGDDKPDVELGGFEPIDLDDEDEVDR